MNADQLDFARKHGITQCPPSPAFRVVWHGRFDDRTTEDDTIRSWSLTDIPVDWLEAARLFYQRKTGNRLKHHSHKNGKSNGRH